MITRGCGSKGFDSKGGDTGNKGCDNKGKLTCERLWSEPSLLFHSYAMPLMVRSMLGLGNTRACAALRFSPRTCWVVVAVLTLTRIIKSVVTGQAPVTLELRNTPMKNTNKPKVVYACITADAIHASTRNI